MSKSPSWGLVVVCISLGRLIQKPSFKTFAEIPIFDMFEECIMSKPLSGWFATKTLKTDLKFFPLVSFRGIIVVLTTNAFGAELVFVWAFAKTKNINRPPPIIVNLIFTKVA